MREPTDDKTNTPERNARLGLRRHFLQQMGVSLGAIALGALESGCESLPVVQSATPTAKNVIFLTMDGGPSQLELFDYKPELQRRDGELAPASITETQRFAFMDTRFAGELRLLGTTRQFSRYGRRGTWISELLPHTAAIADDIAIVRGLRTDVSNHAPALAMLNTGFFRYGRPSMGSWCVYALGTENESLPGFVVMRSGPRGPRSGILNWSNGFLPAQHQGVHLRPEGEPLLNLATPRHLGEERQARTLDVSARLNAIAQARHDDPQTAARMAAYELAGRMQLEAPEMADLGSEPDSTLKAYGAEPDVPSFARNCLLARRLVERGVRFVQLYHSDWDHHGLPDRTLGKDLENRCREVDQASAALVQDLKQRGLLDETLVVWGGEFGRTPMGERTDHAVGRNHHIHSGALWMAGGGIQAVDYGQTDDLGFFAVEDALHIHDLHATMLRALGLDFRALTYRSQGRDFRLTDTGGRIVSELLPT